MIFEDQGSRPVGLSKLLPEDRKEAKRSRFLLVMSFELDKNTRLQVQLNICGEDSSLRQRNAKHPSGKVNI